MAISDETALYLLEFVDCKGLERKLSRFPRSFIEGETALTHLIQESLTEYFLGKPFCLPFPLCPFGTAF